MSDWLIHHVQKKASLFAGIECRDKVGVVGRRNGGVVDHYLFIQVQYILPHDLPSLSHSITFLAAFVASTVAHRD